MTTKSPHSVLLVSSSDKGIAAITKIIDKTMYTPLATAATAGEARRLLGSQRFDIVVINAPLSDEFGAELAFFINENACSGIIILVRADISETIAAKTEDIGVITESKPIDVTSFHHSLKLLSAMQDKYASLLNENKKLQLKLDEIRLVQRAKKVLMECLKMSEPQAHHYIERQAMDMRITRYEVANSIIKTYTDSY